MRKRILSLLLVAAMLLLMIPTTVFAASYTFDENATIFTQNFTTETPRPNNLGEYFTVTSTPFAPSDGTTTWNTGTNGTSANVFNMNSSKKYGPTHAVLTFTFKKSCNFWMKFLFSIRTDPRSYVEISLNGVSQVKGTSDNKLVSPYSLDVKKGDVLTIDFYSDEDFNTPCQMTLKNIRCTDLATQDAKITFDSNETASGHVITGSMDVQTVNIGEATPLNANGFTNTYTKNYGSTNYGGEVKFLGWNTKADGTGTAYADGAEITASGDTTLYAQWASSSVLVHYDLNNPDDPDAVNPSSTTDVGFRYNIPDTEPTREGYTFGGWHTAPIGGETITEKYSNKYTVLNDARPYQSDANEGEKTFYAHWTKYISVTIDPGDYTGSISGGNWISTGIHNQLETRMNTMLGKWTGSYRPAGKVFEGWYIKNEDGSYGDKVYPLDTQYDFTNKLGDHVTFIAKWVVPTYVVKYEANNASATGTMEDQTIEFGADTALKECAYTVKGYHFTGWTDTAGNTYKDGETINRTWTDANTNGEVLTLSATWKEGINYQEALDKVFVEGNLYNPGTNEAIVYDKVTSDVHFPTTRDLGKYTYDKYGLGFDGSVTPVVIESSDSDVIVAPDTPNSARVAVYRPLPREDAKEVTITVKIMNRPGGAGTGYTGTLAEKKIKLTVQPLTTDEISAAAAFMKKVCTKDVYWEGIRKANSDQNNITGDLQSFIEIVPNGEDGYKFIRTEEDSKGVGVKADEIDGWYESQKYRTFRSSEPDIISHENLLLTKPQYITEVTIDSVLSYSEYAKYWEKFKDNKDYAQFEQFYKQPVSVTLMVPGTSLKEVEAPVANTGLIYDGTEKIGVNEGTGYTLSGYKNTDAGNYTAQATLAVGYVWSDGTSDAKEIAWSIEKAEQSAPTGLEAARPSVAGAPDGKITGTGRDMEYRKEGEDAWTDCTGTEITDLAAGNYEVRLKETANYKASEVVTITVAEGDVPTYALTIVDGSGSGSYEAGSSVEIKANAPKDGKQFDKWVLVSGEADIADVNSESTTVTTKGTEATIEARYKDADKTTPGGDTGKTDKDNKDDKTDKTDTKMNNSTGKTGNKSNSASPKTGDSSLPIGSAAALFVSGGMLAMWVLVSKRKRKIGL